MQFVMKKIIMRKGNQNEHPMTFLLTFLVCFVFIFASKYTYVRCTCFWQNLNAFCRGHFLQTNFYLFRNFRRSIAATIVLLTSNSETIKFLMKELMRSWTKIMTLTYFKDFCSTLARLFLLYIQDLDFENGKKCCYQCGRFTKSRQPSKSFKCH